MHCPVLMICILPIVEFITKAKRFRDMKYSKTEICFDILLLLQLFYHRLSGLKSKTENKMRQCSQTLPYKSDKSKRYCFIFSFYPLSVKNSYSTNDIPYFHLHCRPIKQKSNFPCSYGILQESPQSFSKNLLFPVHILNS